MLRRRFLQSERDASNAESSASGSGRNIALDHSLGLGSGRSVPVGVDNRAGVANPVPAVGGSVGQGVVRGRDLAGGPIRRRPGTNCTTPTVAFLPQACPDCTDGRVFRTRSSYTEHLKRAHGWYWNKRGWIGPIGRPAGRRDGVSPRAPPPAPRVAGNGAPAGATPPRAACAGASPPRTVVLRDALSRAAASEALVPCSASAPEASLPRTAVSGASMPRTSLAAAVDAPLQPAVATSLPVGTGYRPTLAFFPHPPQPPSRPWRRTVHFLD